MPSHSVPEACRWVGFSKPRAAMPSEQMWSSRVSAIIQPYRRAMSMTWQFIESFLKSRAGRRARSGIGSPGFSMRMATGNVCGRMYVWSSWSAVLTSIMDSPGQQRTTPRVRGTPFASGPGVRRILTLGLGILIGQWLAFGSAPSPTEYAARAARAWRGADDLGPAPDLHRILG